MQFEELLKLVKEVGQAGLTDFEYNEGNLHIKMSARREEEAAGAEPGDMLVETNIPVEYNKEVIKEVLDAPIEGVFYFSHLDGTSCEPKLGDHIMVGQVLGMMESRGNSFEITSPWEGKLINIYIEDGEELVAREPMFRIEV
ncbi:MAG: hypothetical protein IJ137_07655 [Eubacterium sp.]|nr:hypothetical protein [Eubacterium sp.]